MLAKKSTAKLRETKNPSRKKVVVQNMSFISFRNMVSHSMELAKQRRGMGVLGSWHGLTKFKQAKRMSVYAWIRVWVSLAVPKAHFHN